MWRQCMTTGDDSYCDIRHGLILCIKNIHLLPGLLVTKALGI
jgi:hypothetical protein